MPRYLDWTAPTNSPPFTGGWLYWRTTNGTYLDTQRVQVGLGQDPFDLASITVAKGIYVVAMTLTNSADGTESAQSNELTWTNQNPNKPTLISITQ